MKDIDLILSELTTDEKISLLNGKGSWRINDCNGKVPSIMMTDGPHGLRKMVDETDFEINNSNPATCFPTASAVASSWDPEMTKLMGKTIAREAKKEQVSIVLGCGVNMKRSPLCGRNFEYFSEDPYLAGKLGASYVKGVQGEGIGTSVKHFACNNQETRRQSSNSQVDERALQEIYLRAFEIIVRESQPTTLMASYNRINGAYGCANRHTLVELLRDTWGFKGGVMSDWGATMNAIECHRNGLTLEMPNNGGYHDKKIKEALENGSFTEEELNNCCREVLRTMASLSDNIEDGCTVDYDEHHEIARRIEGNSAVLLKNDNVLPVDTSQKLIVVGELAEHMRYQGGGSSHITVTKQISAIEALKNAGYNVTYLQGYHTESAKKDDKLHNEAAQYIKEHAEDENTVVLYFIGLNDATESEGFDRVNLNIPACQTELLSDVCHATNLPIVAVTFGGAPMDYSWEIGVNAILHMYLGGQAVSEAIADLISGKVAPSGRLAETVPYKVEDTPSYKYFGLPQDDVEYRESIFIGYRYYETFDVPVRFPFGYGLTYTSFKYSDMKVDRSSYDGGKLEVTCKVKNTGDVAGAEVVQLYIMPPKDDIIRASKELKAFKKVYLEPGEEKEVKLELDERAFAIYCADTKTFEMISGDYEIALGMSVRDIMLTEKVEVLGREYFRNERELFPSYFNKSANGFEIPADEFEKLLGQPLSNLRNRKRGEYDITCTFGDVSRASLFGNMVRLGVQSVMKKQLKNVAEDDPFRKMMLNGIEEGALESLLSITGGQVSPNMVEALVYCANGHSIKGIKRFFDKSI